MSATSSSGATDHCAARHRVAQRRVGIDLEHVERRVIGTESDQRVHRLEPLRHRLLRQPHHEVERDVVEAGGARFSQTPRRRAPAEWSRVRRAQLVVAERLHAEAETIDAGRAKRGQPLGGHAFGIGLERDLGVGRQVERLAAGLDDAPQSPTARAATACRRRRRWCRPACRGRAGGFRRAAPGRTALQVRIEQPAIEVAVVADGGAEGDVNVEAEHGPDRNRHAATSSGAAADHFRSTFVLRRSAQLGARLPGGAAGSGGLRAAWLRSSTA